MPRRSTRPAALTQDNIENDEPDQGPSQQDSVQDADQPMDTGDEPEVEQKPLARSKKSTASSSDPKKTKTRSEKSRKSRSRRDAPDLDDSELENAPTSAPPFDRDEFLAIPRPISKEGVKTIEGVESDLRIASSDLRNVGFALASDTAVAVEEVSGDTKEGLEAIKQLDVVMRQLIDAQYELQVHQDSLKSLRERTIRGDVIDKLEDVYLSSVRDAIETYDSRTARQKYAKDKDYFKFRDRLWEVNHSDAMPPIGELMPAEDADSDAESDIEIGGMTQDYKCPLTLVHITNPLTSKLCNHSFSADAIREYLTSARGRKACPASGCNQVLTMADLEPNEDLAKRAAAAARRAKQREEDSDDSDGEVVD